MRARLCLALAIGLVPAAAFAQDGLRSASLPERRMTHSLTPPPDDVFLATPDTYGRNPRRRMRPVFGGFGLPLYPVAQPIIIVQIPRESLESSRVAPQPVLPGPVLPLAPYVAGIPGRPKTFYIIPGCYAGDRRPEPETLKPGCDISRLRVVLPRP